VVSAAGERKTREERDERDGASWVVSKALFVYDYVLESLKKLVDG
jgi:hypothetical protein